MKNLKLAWLSSIIIFTQLYSMTLEQMTEDQKKNELFKALYLVDKNFPKEILSNIFFQVHPSTHSKPSIYDMTNGGGEYLPYPSTINNLVPVELIYTDSGNIAKKAKENSLNNNFQVQIHYKRSKYLRIDDDGDGSSLHVNHTHNINRLEYDGPNKYGEVVYIIASNQNQLTLHNNYIYLPGGNKCGREKTRNTPDPIIMLDNSKINAIALEYSGTRVALSTTYLGSFKNEETSKKFFLDIYDYKEKKLLKTLESDAAISKFVWINHNYAIALMKNEVYFVTLDPNENPVFNKQTFKDSKCEMIDTIMDIAVNPLCPKLISFLANQSGILTWCYLNLAKPLKGIELVDSISKTRNKTIITRNTFKKIKMKNEIYNPDTSYSIWSFGSTLGLLEVNSTADKRVLTIINQDNVLLDCLEKEGVFKQIEEAATYNSNFDPEKDDKTKVITKILPGGERQILNEESFFSRKKLVGLIFLCGIILYFCKNDILLKFIFNK